MFSITGGEFIHRFTAGGEFIHRFITAWKKILLPLFLLLFFCIQSSQPLLAVSLPPSQVYYIPLPETEIFSTFNSLTSFSTNASCTDLSPAEPMTTYISVVPMADNAIIYYDHWEDDFDSDIVNPAAGSSTEIWGDGDPTNGFTPAYPTDIFSAGDVIVLTSTITSTITGTLNFDGGDKVATNKAIAMSRTSWASQTATKLAGALEMFDTRHWGTSYHIPIGQNVLSGSNMPEPFEYTALSVMAAQDNTQLYFNGTLVATLDEGESYFMDGGIMAHDLVTASAPVQVNLVTGDLCAAYESRWYALYPDAYLSHSYYTPVSTVNGSEPAQVFLYNPNLAPMTVERTLVDGSTDVINLPAGETVLSSLPNTPLNSGASFISTDGSPFSAIANVWGPNYDWGFNLSPVELLTPGVTVGLGLGKDPTISALSTISYNGSPIWVMPVIPPGGPPTATLVIDYDHDGSRVDRVDLGHLESYQVFDPVDEDQTGISLYIDTPFLSDSSYVKLAAAWGQVPMSLTADIPGLDMGTTQVPAPLFVAQKQNTLATDLNNNGELNPGDTLIYTIVVQNVSVLPISDLIISDTVPLYTEYIPNSTMLGTSTLSTGDSIDFPLDEGGYTIATLLGNETITLTFGVTATVPPTITTLITNVATIAFIDQILYPASSIAITGTPDFDIEILINGQDPDDQPYILAGEPVTWTYILTNTGHIPLDLTLTDIISDGVPNLIGGDDDGDGIFEPGETWIYTAVVTPPSTPPDDTSTGGGTIRGERDDTVFTQTVTTDFFAADLTLEVEKVASVDTITMTTAVTYTYIVTNSGNVTMTPTLNDDRCAPLLWQATSDLGDDGLLSTDEVWHYHCSMMVSTDLTNTVVVTAFAPGGLISKPITDTAFVDRLPAVTLQKDVTPATRLEPGGLFTYTLTLENIAPEPATIISLNDTHSLSTECLALVGTTLAVGESVSCRYTANHTGVGSYENQATATVRDDEGNETTDDAEATAQVTDELPTVTLTKLVTPTSLPAPGGIFTYTLLITNTSVGETINLIELRDTYLLSAGCRALVGTSLAPGEVATCEYTVEHLGGGVHENSATVVVTDDEDNRIEEDNADDDIPPAEVIPTALAVEKRPSSEVAVESGEMISFTVTITNVSTEVMTLVALTDNLYGNLNGRGSCVMGQTLRVGQSYQCIFTEFVSGEVGANHTNTVIATALNQDNEFFQGEGSATIFLYDALPEILVTKNATPAQLPEPGGLVTFTLSIENRSLETVTMTTLVDDIYGPLHGQGSCAVPQVLAMNERYECGWTVDFNGDPGFSEVDTVTATAHDRTGNVTKDSDDAMVLITNVPSTLQVLKSANVQQVAEPGEAVVFQVVVTNTSPVDTVVLDTMLDSVYGDLTNSNNSALLNTDCTTGDMLAVGESTACSFTAFVAGQPSDVHQNSVTVVGTDNDDMLVTSQSTLAIDVTNVPPAASVVKLANTVSVPPPGANVTFAITVANQSLVDSITITALEDDQFGNLATLPNSTCTLSQTLAVGESYSCEFVGYIEGDDGHTHINTVEAGLVDDDGFIFTAQDTEVVLVLGVTEIVVQKEATQNNVPESGELVDFTVTVSNTGSSGDVTLTLLSDSIYGDLSLVAGTNCMVPQTLAMGQAYRCSFPGWVAGQPGDVHENVVTASVMDRFDDVVQGEDTEALDIADVLSSISIRKLATPNQVLEPGGEVRFDVTIQNDSAVDSVTLNTLVDDVYGDLTIYPTSDCQMPQELRPDETYSCSFTVFVSGEANTSHQNTMIISATDDDGLPALAQATAITEILNTLAEIEVTKSADKLTVAEAGETVRFTVDVRNVSASDSVTLTAMIDSVYGNLTAHDDSTCTMPQFLEPDQQYSCEFSAFLSLENNGSNTHVNTVIVTALDDDQLTVAGGLGSTGVEGADELEIVIGEPHLSASKVDAHTDVDSDNLVSANDFIDYTIVLHNSSLVTVTDVTVEDVLGEYGNFGGLLMSTQGTIQQTDNRSILVNVGDIRPLQSVTITLATAITNQVHASGLSACVENQATVRGANIQPFLTDDPDTVSPQDSTSTSCDPTAISLAYFTASWLEGHAHIQWVTSAEFDTWGFHIWRAEDQVQENAIRVTDSSVLSGAPGGLYSIVDQDVGGDTHYYYWLEETTLDGSINFHGPIQLEPDPLLRTTDEMVQLFFLPVVWR